MQIENLVVISFRREPGVCWFGYKLLQLVLCKIFFEWFFVWLSGFRWGWENRKIGLGRGEKVVFRPRQVSNPTKRVPRQDISAYKNIVWYVNSHIWYKWFWLRFLFSFDSGIRQNSSLSQNTQQKKRHYKTFQNFWSGMILWFLDASNIWKTMCKQRKGV